MNTLDTTSASRNPAWDSIASFLDFWLNNNLLTGEERAAFDAYYRSYRRQFSPYMRHHFVAQTKEMTDLIRKADAPKLLEIGAGCGTESLWFSLLGADVTGLDLANDRLATARARHKVLEQHLSRSVRARFIEVSLFDFAAPSPFDLIWMEQTFHHLEPREQVFNRLYDLLKPGGTLVICEVNGWNLLLQAQFFLQRGWKTRTSFVDANGRQVEYGNERITTPQALRRGLEGAGFTVETVRPFRLLPNSNPPHEWLSVENAIVSRLPFLSTHFNTVAIKPV